MLFPFDKPIDDCKLALRQPGLDLVSRSQFWGTLGYLGRSKQSGQNDGSLRKRTRRRVTPNERQRR